MRHRKTHVLPTIDPPPPFFTKNSCFYNFLYRFCYIPTEDENVFTFIQNFPAFFDALFRAIYDGMGQFRFMLAAKVNLDKEFPVRVDEIFCFCTKPLIIRHPSNIEEIVQRASEDLLDKLERFCHRGSNWNACGIKHLDIHVGKYIGSQSGGHAIKLDKFLRTKHCVVNVVSRDDKCFLYSVLVCLHPEVKNNRNIVTTWLPYVDEITWMEYPMKLTSFRRFEELNKIQLFVYGYEDTTVFAIYAGKVDYEKKVCLLYVEDSHFCAITDFDRLMGRCAWPGRFCNFCCLNLYDELKLKSHVEHCKNVPCQRLEFPKNKTLKYKNKEHQLPKAYVVYADFEAILKPISGAQPDPVTSSTVKTQEHEACGYSWVMVDYLDNVVGYEVYRGKDCVERFLRTMNAKVEWIKERLLNPVPILMTDSDWINFNDAKDCNICRRRFDEKVRDHCHITGKYRQALCNTCNLNLRLRPTLNVYCHNMKNYDGHLIVKKLSTLHAKRINLIAKNAETYMAITVDQLKFLDTFSFLSTSLDKLVALLYKEYMQNPSTQLDILKHVFPENYNGLLRKGIYPYNYMTCWSKFEETSLPPKEAFYSDLTAQHISQEDYDYGCEVWTKSNCKTLGDYHNLYLLLDSVLLACVFQRYRKKSMDNYNLDVCHFISLPSYSWSCALYKTGVELQLLQDPDMYLMVEKGIRGGVSQISLRHAVANNPRVPNYKPELPETYLVYWDANNLYGEVSRYIT
jgi:hypothetical protein